MSRQQQQDIINQFTDAVGQADWPAGDGVKTVRRVRGATGLLLGSVIRVVCRALRN